MSARSSRIQRHLGRLGRAAFRPLLREAFGGRPQAEPAFAGGGLAAPREPDLVCVFCGTADHVIPHRGKGICVDCVREVRQIVSAG